MKTLVTYFSASGVTQKVAKKIAQAINADLFEIEPMIKYTTKDLDWTNKLSRSSLEMKDKLSRPKIVNKVTNINDYDTVLIGFPIWWYTAPTIINTFIEENDLNNKEIYVFATSGGTGVEKAFNDLNEAYPNLRFKNAKRFTGRENIDDYKLLLERENN